MVLFPDTRPPSCWQYIDTQRGSLTEHGLLYLQYNFFQLNSESRAPPCSEKQWGGNQQGDALQGDFPDICWQLKYRRTQESSIPEQEYLGRKINVLKNSAASSLASASTMSISHPFISSSLLPAWHSPTSLESSSALYSLPLLSSNSHFPHF